ncbi:hypothetical protein M0R45_033782 [Rubus argutus]|uniref:Uncharacterized protein n=1 Tax=Rubus argutus TaxID=59490 RepID=A0AAW1WMT2_RUBAR
MAGLKLKITIVVRSWVLKIDADGGGCDIMIWVATNGDVIEGSNGRWIGELLCGLWDDRLGIGKGSGGGGKGRGEQSTWLGFDAAWC